MTIDKLRAMNDGQLFHYFSKNARHNRVTGYWIRLPGHSRAIFSDDTADLRVKFFAAVRAKKEVK